MKEDWVECIFEDVLEIKNGKNQKLVEDRDGKYPIYGSSGIIGRANQFICDEGSTIIGRKGTINSPIFVNTKFWNVDTAFGLSPYNILHERLLYYFTILFNFHSLDKSTTVPSLAKSDLLRISFNLPPLPIQRAIVKKIEQLFSALDAGVADLKKAKEQLKVYRQAVLKKAFEGELTKKWREKQKDLSSVEEILQQIEKEKEHFYNTQLKNWKIGVGNWEKNGKVGKKPIKPSKLTIPDLPTDNQNNLKWLLPSQWTWKQLGYVAFVTKLAGFEYTDYVRYDEFGDLPVLKAENVRINGFKQSEYSLVKSESVLHLKRTELFGNELLVVFVGAGTGNVASVPTNRKFFLGPNIGMCRTYFEFSGKFLEYFYSSKIGKQFLMSSIKAVAQPSLSMGTIRQAPLIICSLQEQLQIVKEIEARLSVCDALEQQINTSLQQAEALRQSILKKAFAGELLTDSEIAACKKEADYEPASILLERIKAEKVMDKIKTKATTATMRSKIAADIKNNRIRRTLV